MASKQSCLCLIPPLALGLRPAGGSRGLQEVSRAGSCFCRLPALSPNKGGLSAVPVDDLLEECSTTWPGCEIPNWASLPPFVLDSDLVWAWGFCSFY